MPDWEVRVRECRSLLPDLPLFEDQASRAVRIFSRMRIPDVTGNPTFGDVARPWMFDLVRSVFGSLDPETMRRQIREFFFLMPKKNGKTAIAAVIILIAAIMNVRPAAQLLLLAPTITIARYSFDYIEGIIKLDPALADLFHCRGNNVRTITHRTSGAEIVIKAADTDTVTGGKFTFSLIDETHEFARKSNAAAVFTEVRGALSARPEGFLVQITTQSKTPPAGVFKAELDKARSVRDGTLRLPLLPVLYELPADMAKDWRKPETWAMVNPNLGISVDPAFLADEIVAKEEEGAAALALLASQHFNVEIGVGLGGEWVGATYWADAATAGLKLDELIERSEVAVMGIDGGGLDDLLGVSVIGRDTDTKNWLAWFHAWAQSDVMQRRKEIAPRLEDFARDGDLTILPPDATVEDIVAVADIAERLHAAGLLPKSAAIGLDPAGVSAIVDELACRGLADEQMAAISQGYRLSPAIWGMERKLKNGTLRHGGQPMMNWVLGNAKIEQRGSAVLVTKEAAGKAKIDPLVAGFNAFMLMARNPAAKPKSYLSRRGLVVA